MRLLESSVQSNFIMVKVDIMTVEKAECTSRGQDACLSHQYALRHNAQRVQRANYVASPCYRHQACYIQEGQAHREMLPGQVQR